jgi:hypothetical protein
MWGPGPFGGLPAGGLGETTSLRVPPLPGRAVVLLVILIGPWDTRCWPCSPGRPAGPGDCSGRDQAVQSVDELEESVSGCGDWPGPAEVWVWTAIVLGGGWPVARSSAWPTRRGWVRARISRRSGAFARRGSPLLWQAARHVTSTIAAQNPPRTVCLPRRRPRRGRPAALASCDPQAAKPVQ